MILMSSSTIQDRFKKFRKKKKESILKYKDKIQIVIYGAYNPPNDGTHLGEKKRLEKLRDRLKIEGYTNTALVDDFEGNDILEKSLDALEFADLNIIIFTCRGKTGSVSRELIEAINKPGILWKCRIYEEAYKGIPAMETLIKEELEEMRYKTVQVEREDDNDLFEYVVSDIFQFLRRYVNGFAMR